MFPLTLRREAVALLAVICFLPPVVRIPVPPTEMDLVLDTEPLPFSRPVDLHV